VRSQNGDTKTATEKCDQIDDKEKGLQLNASRKVANSLQSTTALQLGLLLNGSKQTLKKL